ncbi:MAG: hypothetical protein ABIH92_03075 [Nanoarchaeota archaeon]
MINKIIYSLIVLLIIIPLATAATPININTERLADVRVFVMAHNGIEALESFHENSGVEGRVTFISEVTVSEVDLLLTIKRNDNIIHSGKIGPYPTAAPIELTIPENLANPVDPVVDDTITDAEETVDDTEATETDTEETDNTEGTEEQTDSEEITDTTITGNVMADSDSNSNLLTVFYYTLGAIILIGIILFFVIAVVARGKKNAQHGMQPVKFSGPPPPSYGDDPELSHIEKEIELVEKEIDSYKKRTRIQDAEKRLTEKKRMLDQMKHGPSHPHAQAQQHPHQTHQQPHQHHQQDQHKKLKKYY